MFERGIRSRTIYLSSVRNDANTLKYVEWLNSYGAEVRTTPILPIRMIISDGATAVLPIDPGDTKYGISVYRNPAIVLSLLDLFEKAWSGASPLGMISAKNDQFITEEERAILELLAVGIGDVEIAQKMGISDRTVRRILERIMRSLNVKSRFEVCYRATKNGWL